MRGVDTVVDAVMDHSKVVIAVMLVLTVAIGSGAAMVEQTSSLDQFQSDSPEGDALDYANENFSTGDDDTTTAQVIQRDDDVFDKSSLVGLLEYQQTLHDNETVDGTLAGDQPTASVATAIAATEGTARPSAPAAAASIASWLARHAPHLMTSVPARSDTPVATA